MNSVIPYCMKKMVAYAALLDKGVDYLKSLLVEIEKWLESHNYKSSHEIQGIMSHKSTIQSALWERANYLKVLDSYHKT